MQQDEKFRKIYDFYRLVIYAQRYKRNDITQGDKKHENLREPLVVGKKRKSKKARCARCFL